MALYLRAACTIPRTGGLPKDNIVNTFAFTSPGGSDRDLAALNIAARLDGFYTAIKDHLSSAYAWASARVSVLDLTDDQPRIPFYDEEISITAPSTTNNDLPSEVACVLSFEGERASGVNMRRRRGRVYVGPLQVPSGDTWTVGSAMYNLIATAASDHLLNPASPVVEWAVYSPYTHHGIPVGEKLTPDDPEIPDFLPASFTPVARAWVDNAFDTQRRRGLSPTTRVTVTAA